MKGRHCSWKRRSTRFLPGDACWDAHYGSRLTQAESLGTKAPTYDEQDGAACASLLPCQLGQWPASLVDSWCAFERLTDGGRAVIYQRRSRCQIAPLDSCQICTDSTPYDWTRLPMDSEKGRRPPARPAYRRIARSRNEYDDLACYIPAAR